MATALTILAIVSKCHHLSPLSPFLGDRESGYLDCEASHHLTVKMA